MINLKRYKKSILIVGTFFVLYTFAWIVFFQNARIDMHQQRAPIQKTIDTSFIAPSVLSEKTRVQNKVVAEKLDLERKIIKPTTPQKVAEITRVIKQQGGEILRSSPGIIVAHIPKASEEQIQQSLIATNSTKSLEVDYPTFLTVDNPDWGVKRIKAPDVWETTKADGIKIAVIDTGIDYNHKDLQGRYAGGYDTANDDTDPYDDHGHGTHVSGIVSTALDGAGLVGVAPGGQILAVKALGADGSGYISDVVEAVDWAMNNGSQVMNFSLGTTYDSQTLEDKLNEAAAKGIVLVAAAGNTSGGSLLYPAAYGSVISVAATDSNDNFASFSSVGAELAAPGVAVTSTIPGGGYATWSGTSMAAPHVAATVGLMIANKQTTIRQNLQNTAIDLGPSGKDSYYGYGLVHAKPAALGEDVLAPVVSVLSPENNSTVHGQVEVQLDVQDENTVNSVKLFINNLQVQEWSQAPYTYSWNTTGKDGAYELLVQAKDEYDNTGEAKISVTVSKDPLTPTPTASPTPTLTQVKQQEQSGDVRQDINQEQAAENRQNYNHVPNSPQEEAQKSEEKKGGTESHAPEVSNINERNQKPDTLPAQASENAQGKGVKGVTNIEKPPKNLFDAFFDNIRRSITTVRQSFR
jgi:subtilisin